MKKIITRVFTGGILIHNGKILILKRKSDDPMHPEFWDILGGFFKENESAEDCVTRETKEEIGLDVNIKKVGKVYEVMDDYGRAICIPFLLETKSKKQEPKIKISEEHSEYKWIEPKHIKNYECAPDIFESAKILGVTK